MISANYSERISALRGIALFKHIDDDCLNYVVRHARMRTYDEGQIIFQQGDVCTSLFIIMSGNVNISFCSEDGREVIISELHAGDLIGEVELMSNCLRLTNGFAAKKTQVLMLERSTLERFLDNSAFARALINAICLRLRQVVLFAEGISIYSLETRLARLLIDMSRTHGKHVCDGILIDRPISQSQIGQMIKASRPKINMQLQAWKFENLIRVYKNQITILDQQYLEQLSRQKNYTSIRIRD